MAVELSKESRQEAQSSLQRYFEENLDGPIGNLAAAQLLDFVLEEIGPSIYNRAVAEVQQRLQAKLGDLETEVFADEFQYWRRRDRPKRKG